ncbi:hypothetical protein F5Y07DRAFT_246523 [Xylaria sp. FL0933]|nr:hypothetical protein F5Y07DRAFT_246523 [Xylaria sp. FL0933]
MMYKTFRDISSYWYPRGIFLGVNKFPARFYLLMSPWHIRHNDYLIRQRYDPYEDFYDNCAHKGIFHILDDVSLNSQVHVTRQENPMIFIDVYKRWARLATSIHIELKRSEGISALTERQKFPVHRYTRSHPRRRRAIRPPSAFVLISSENQSILPRINDQIIIQLYNVEYSFS